MPGTDSIAASLLSPPLHCALHLLAPGAGRLPNCMRWPSSRSSCCAAAASPEAARLLICARLLASWSSESHSATLCSCSGDSAGSRAGTSRGRRAGAQVPCRRPTTTHPPSVGACTDRELRDCFFECFRLTSYFGMLKGTALRRAQAGPHFTVSPSRVACPSVRKRSILNKWERSRNAKVRLQSRAVADL